MGNSSFNHFFVNVVKAKQQRRVESGISQSMMGEGEQNTHETSGLMMRILGPVTTYVNKPWKVSLLSTLF